MPDAGKELVHNELAVPHQRRGPHLARRDHVEPVLKPLADGRRFPRCPGGSGVALAPKLPHLRHHRSALGPGDVAPVAGAVLLPSRWRTRRSLAWSLRLTVPSLLALLTAPLPLRLCVCATRGAVEDANGPAVGLATSALPDEGPPALLG